MLTFMPTRLAAFKASQSAVRRGVPHIGSPYLRKASKTIIKAKAAPEDQPPRYRHRCIPGKIESIGSLQSQFNPHTSTALAA
jgi:hypothetical protein